MPRKTNYLNNLFIFAFSEDNKPFWSEGGKKGRTIRNHRGQALGEYALILGLTIGVFTVMQIYVRRELQGRLKDASDKAIADIRQAKGDSSLALQYEPYYSAADVTTETLSRGNSRYFPEGRNVETINESIQRKGTQTQYPYNYDAGAGGQ